MSQSLVSCTFQHRDSPVKLSHRVRSGVQDKQRPDTPIQRRTSARLAELPPSNKGLTGDEHERHGAALPTLLHQLMCCMDVIPCSGHPCHQTYKVALPSWPSAADACGCLCTVSSRH